MATNWRRILAITFLVQIFTAIGFSVVNPFLPLYVEDLGTRTGLSVEFWAGAVFSIQGLTMMLVSPFWGVVADRHGRKLMVTRAVLGGGLTVFLMGFARSAEELTALRGAQGAIAGTVSASNALVAAAVPREQVGFAMGLLQVGLRGGVAFGPLVGGLLADSFGFRLPFILMGVLLSATGLLVLFGIDEQFAPDTISADRRNGFVDGWRHVLKMPGVPQTLVIRFLTSASRTIIIPIAPLFLLTLLSGNIGVSTFTGLTFGVGSLVATVSAIYLGRLGDRIGHRRTVTGSALAAMVAYGMMTLVADEWQFLALMAAAGIGLGGLLAAPSALLTQYTEPGEEGTVFGLDNSVTAAGRAISPLVGSGIALTVGYRGVFAAAGLLSLMAFLFALYALPRDKPRAADPDSLSSESLAK